MSILREANQSRLTASLPLVRAVVAALVVLLVPALLSLGALREDGTIEVGTTAPRTIIADETITITDEDATDVARRQAAESVTARTASDPEARAAIVNDTRAIFAGVLAARSPRAPLVDPTDPPSPGQEAEQVTLTRTEQEAELQASFPNLSSSLIGALVALPDDDLPQVRSETVELAQDFARNDVTSEDLGAELEAFLQLERPLLAMSDEYASSIAAPVMESVARPTIIVDADATETARQEAAEAVESVTTVWQPGDPIVTQGQVVEEAAVEALQQSGLEASSAPFRYLRALGAMLLVVVVLGVYLWQMQPRVWRSPRKLALLAAVIVGYAGLVTGVSWFSEAGQVAWWYLVPVGALAMLIALLVHPVVAIASMLPAVVMVTLSAPLSNGVAVFTAAAVLTCVPLTIGLASRGDLRSATLRAGIAMPVIAALAIGVFGPRAEFWPAVGAAALNGVLIALLVQGLLPFLETTFRLPTVTALLDLADRNHPLMRELETKAIGSYNHSVMVASLTERACREIGANPLLGSVAALYHDIGKVRRPHFFIENQYGIPNPHDDLEPQVSALIIQEHVVDGVRMATEYRLPPEVVAAIASHHGTMLVSYFYNKAVEAAGGDESRVDEEAFRYKGSKPRSKEAAVLLIADCSEAATRAMAMSRGTLPRGLIETTVDSLLETRIEDGQFDECDLTFDELHRVRESVVAALEGIYHPRIAYPAGGSRPGDRSEAASRDDAVPAVTGRARVDTSSPESPADAQARADAEPDASDHDGSGPEGSGPDGSGPDGSDPDGSDPDGSDPDASDPDASDPTPAAPDLGHADAHDDHDRALVTPVQDLEDITNPEVAAQRP